MTLCAEFGKKKKVCTNNSHLKNIETMELDPAGFLFHVALHYSDKFNQR